MPPSGKLSAEQIASLEHWVRLGAPDPRDAATPTPAAGTKQIDLEQGRKWWAFQPVETQDVTVNDDAGWAKTKVDRFILAKLQENHLEPSPAADRAVLIRRAYLDLTGLRPTYEQVEAFAKDDSPDAYEHVIEQLLASPHYGERWGRYWLDVARYGEDNPHRRSHQPALSIRLALSRLGDRSRQPRRAVRPVRQAATGRRPDARHAAAGSGGARLPGRGAVYHKDGRLSKDVIETLYTDDWDERVDVVSRGLLGLTVACARCHDHKFDPIPTTDYYALAGVFASTVPSPRPLAEVDPEAETDVHGRQRSDSSTSATSPTCCAANRARKRRSPAEGGALHGGDGQDSRTRSPRLRDEHPEMYAYLSQLAKRPKPYPDEEAGRSPHRRLPAPRQQQRGVAAGAAHRMSHSFRRCSTPACGSMAPTRT